MRNILDWLWAAAFVAGLLAFLRLARALGLYD